MNNKSSPGDWISIGIDTWSLGIDAAAVIGLRVAKIAAGGPAANREAERMISEKIESSAHIHAALLTGAFGASPAMVAHNVVKYWSGEVRANRKRFVTIAAKTLSQTTENSLAFEKWQFGW